jgi:hypothetical protein
VRRVAVALAAFGFPVTFLTLAAIAGASLSVFAFAMPERCAGRMLTAAQLAAD